jgi:hypothetical protein
MATGSKSSRIIPALGEAFLTSAKVAVVFDLQRARDIVRKVVFVLKFLNFRHFSFDNLVENTGRFFLLWNRFFQD